MMRHEKRYVEKSKKDRTSQIDDNTKRSKQAYNLEFDDYRKGKGSSRRAEAIVEPPRRGDVKKKKARNV